MLATLCIIVVLDDDILDRTRNSVSNRIAFLTTDGHCCLWTTCMYVNCWSACVYFCLYLKSFQ